MNKTWEYNGRTWRLMTETEYQNALESIADEFIKAGYEVSGISSELECMDIWGYETVPKRKRRRKCFLEIYSSIGAITDDMKTIVFSHPDYDQQESIEVVFDNKGYPDIKELLKAVTLIIDPLKVK